MTEAYRQKVEANYGSLLTRAIVSLAKEGKSDKQIAAALRVPVSVFSHWIEQNPKLRKGLESSRVAVEALAENALLELSLGYSHPEVKVFYNAKEDMIVEHTITKHYPPNIAALQFLLKNINPEKWKERQELVVEPVLGTVKNINEAIGILSADPARLDT